MNFGIGQPVRRTEDARLLAGRGRFTDDIDLPGQAHMAVVRSPHAHARLRALEAAGALAMPGVLGVLTANDLAADGIGGIPALVRDPGFAFSNRDGTEMPDPPYPVLAAGKVRYAGEPVAVVVAETRAAALDAAEAVTVDYAPLAAVSEAAAALAPGAPLLRVEAPGNQAFDWETGDAAAVDSAFAGAAHVARIEVVNNRVVHSYLEPRAALAAYDVAAGRYTLYVGSQGAHRQKNTLALVLGIDAERVRVISGDVGGGFGGKGFVYPEHVLVAWAARRLGRPVKWTGTRAELFLADLQARDHVTRGALALDRDGRFLALGVDGVCNLGANVATHAVYVPIFHMSRMMSGAYAIPHIRYHITGAYTNTAPVHVYRGVGRAEAAYLIERLVDRAAAETGIDPVALRRRNFIAPEAMPYTSPMGAECDSGAYAAGMDRALALAGWDGFPARRDAARARDRLRGIGLAYYVEDAGGPPTEYVKVRVDPGGAVFGLAGSQSNGQGHATAFAQVLAERLEVPFEDVRIIWGDTDAVRAGVGSFGSRSMQMVGPGLVEASDRVIETGRAVAGHLLEVGPADIEYAGGRFIVAGTDRSVGLFEVAAAMAVDVLPEALRGELAADLDCRAKGDTYPNGCHVAEVEVDPETGVVALTAYTAVDDYGRRVNPMIVEGQLHGAIAQGAGQAMLERTVYDAATGQLLSGSLMDYALPRADHLPNLATGDHETPSPNNPLGIKGAGEGGAIGAPPAVMNAVLDALAQLGVARIDMPATPERVWRAVREAGAG